MLSTKDRQQIYSRLAPVLGEEEAETLLDQFPATADAEPLTVADLRATEARLDHRIDLLDVKIDMVETRLEARIEVLRRDMGTGFERLEKLIYKQMRTQTILMITTIVAVLGLAARTNVFG